MASIRQPKKIVHYLNQFFGGKGGEDQANLDLSLVEGPVGPGRLLQTQMGPEYEVVATLICGDNYAIEHSSELEHSLRTALTDLKPDVLVAGPAFDAGRYGIACGLACKIAGEEGIPAVTAMEPDNPGVTKHAIDAYILPTGADAVNMPQIIASISDFTKRLVEGPDIGAAYDEGFIPRGIRRRAESEHPTHKRAVSMLLDKLNGKEYQSEIPVISPDRVNPAPPIEDLSEALVGMITTGGLVPKGNPERQTSGNPDRYYKYSIEGLDEMVSDDWEAFHGGYFNITTSENPNYILPLRAVRELERTGEIGSLSPTIFTMPGVGTPIDKARRFGSEMAEELIESGVDACILVAT